MGNRGEPEVSDGFRFPPHDTGHDQDSGLNTGLTKCDSFIHGTHSEPGCAFGAEYAGDLDGSMAIRVCFHNSEDICLRPGRIAHGAEVLS